MVTWYCQVRNGPGEDTGMWIVEAEKDMHGAPRVAVVHLDTIVHAAHLIGIYGDRFYPKIMPEQSLDFFHTFYVNKLPTMVLQ